MAKKERQKFPCVRGCGKLVGTDGGRCSSCAAKERQRDPESEAKRIAALRKKWEDPEFRAKMEVVNERTWQDEDLRKRRAEEERERMTERWKDPEYYAEMCAMSKRMWEDVEYRERQSISRCESWNSGRREKASEFQKARWVDPEFRAHMEPIMVNRLKSVEHRKVVSEALFRRWDNPEYRDRTLNFIKENLLGREDIYVTGFHDSPKAGLIHYRSSYELQAYKLLDEDPTVVSYGSETYIVKYEFDGRHKNYTPDITAILADGSELVIEVKPECKVYEPKNLAKLEAAFKAFPQFELWTERELFGGD